MNFDDVRAQGSAVETLRRAVATGRIAGAYLFEGPAGVGKERAALALASALLCVERPKKGCNRCDVCRRITTGNHNNQPQAAIQRRLGGAIGCSRQVTSSG